MKYYKPYKHKHYLFKKYLLGVLGGGRNIFQQEFSQKKPRDITYKNDYNIYIYERPNKRNTKE